MRDEGDDDEPIYIDQDLDPIGTRRLLRQFAALMRETDADDRAAWEQEELAGLARQRGARRVEVEPGVWAWEFPPVPGTGEGGAMGDETQRPARWATMTTGAARARARGAADGQADPQAAAILDFLAWLRLFVPMGVTTSDEEFVGRYLQWVEDGRPSVRRDGRR